MQEWLKTNIPHEKLLLGVSSYGRTFTLKDENELCPSINTSIDGLGFDGYVALEKGFFSKISIRVIGTVVHSFNNH